MTTIHTFGDSILDCGAYNPFAITPGQLLARNDDRRYPEFRGRDLASQALKPVIDHRARDGGTVQDLKRQASGLRTSGDDIALLTIGGNDLLEGLAVDGGRGILAFERTLRRFLDELPIRPVLIGNVYDPTFGDDARNFLEIDPILARANHERVNGILTEAAERVGWLADLHGHFLSGDESWYERVIEPSLTGASEVRRVFLTHWEDGLA